MSWWVLYIDPKPKQIRKPTRNWLDLPSDLMLVILQRLDVVDRLENAQKVCTAWRRICKDPAMWRVIYMDARSCQSVGICREMCKQAVDRSQGQLVDLSFIGFCDHELFLHCVNDRSSQPRRLEFTACYGEMFGHLSEDLKKLSSLEELSFIETYVSQEDIESAGHYCPLLKTLKLNRHPYRFGNEDNKVALAIGKNLPQLTHLELIQNRMTNIGLEAILDGCCHLVSLDLRGCMLLDLSGNLGKRCSQQIKHLKLPFNISKVL